ncbi:MAG: septum formation inhibitor Maf [Ruminococcaceae bacterium]|nr:septum formation inhibitor Maf [Oscillospiraceae bacterium]
MTRFVLASKSPRRKELLDTLKIEYEVIESSVDESAVSKDELPDIYVQKLAILKSTDVASKIKSEVLVIGADTIVEYEGRFLGKPKTREEAYEMIKLLSGKKHNVYTGICVTNSKTMEFTSTFEKTEIIFNEIEHNEIIKYINTDEPYDKAGGYAIQGYANRFIENIVGDYNNVVGLPVYKLSNILKDEFDIDILD